MLQMSSAKWNAQGLAVALVLPPALLQNPVAKVRRSVFRLMLLTVVPKPPKCTTAVSV
jgi:hypothetical protein